jgi:hypothetical protein
VAREPAEQQVTAVAREVERKAYPPDDAFRIVADVRRQEADKVKAEKVEGPTGSGCMAPRPHPAVDEIYAAADRATGAERKRLQAEAALFKNAFLNPVVIAFAAASTEQIEEFQAWLETIANRAGWMSVGQHAATLLSRGKNMRGLRPN